MRGTCGDRLEPSLGTSSRPQSQFVRSFVPPWPRSQFVRSFPLVPLPIRSFVRSVGPQNCFICHAKNLFWQEKTNLVFVFVYLFDPLGTDRLGPSLTTTSTRPQSQFVRSFVRSFPQPRSRFVPPGPASSSFVRSFCWVSKLFYLSSRKFNLAERQK